MKTLETDAFLVDHTPWVLYVAQEKLPAGWVILLVHRDDPCAGQVGDAVQKHCPGALISERTEDCQFPAVMILLSRAEALKLPWSKGYIPSRLREHVNPAAVPVIALYRQRFGVYTAVDATVVLDETMN